MPVDGRNQKGDPRNAKSAEADQPPLDHPERRATASEEPPDARRQSGNPATPEAAALPIDIPPPTSWPDRPQLGTPAAGTPTPPITIDAISAPLDDELEAALVPAETPDPARAKAIAKPASDSSSRSPSARRARALAAVLAVGVLALGLAMLVVGREAIISAASSLLVIVGFQEPLGAGLEIDAVTSFREETTEGDVLVVEGTITNESDDERAVPLVRVALFDGNDTELQHVIISPNENVLAPAARIAFSARLAQPAPTARRIKVTFAKQREAD